MLHHFKLKSTENILPKLPLYLILGLMFSFSVWSLLLPHWVDKGGVDTASAVSFGSVVSVANTTETDGIVTRLLHVNGVYYLAYMAGSSESGKVYISTSTNGMSWSTPTSIGNANTIGNSVGIDLKYNSLGGYFGLAYVTNGNTKDTVIATSTDFFTWTSTTVQFGSSDVKKPAIAFSTSTDLMVLINASPVKGELLVATSTDSWTWTTTTIDTFAASVDDVRKIRAEVTGPSDNLVLHTIYSLFIGESQVNIRYASSTNLGQTWSTSTVSGLYSASVDVFAYFGVDSGGRGGTFYHRVISMVGGGPTDMVSTLVYGRQGSDFSWTTSTVATGVDHTINNMPEAVAFEFFSENLPLAIVPSDTNFYPVLYVNTSSASSVVGFESYTIASQAMDDSSQPSMAYNSSSAELGVIYVNSADIKFATTTLQDPKLAPTAPSGASIGSITTTTLTVSWTDNATNETSYRVDLYQGSTISGSVATTTGSLPAGTASANFSGLSTSTQYIALVTVTNAHGDNTATTAAVYTLADVPGPLTVGSATASTLTLTLDDNNNAVATTYAIYESATGKYVAADNGLDATTPVWQTTSTWSNPAVSGLTGNKQYTFSIVARNGDNVETTTTTASAAYTLAATPTAATAVASGQTTATFTWTEANNSNGTKFSVYETNTAVYVNSSTLAIGATTAQWGTTSTDWFASANPFTVTGLTAGTEYCFTVAGRNAENTPTATSTATCITTTSASSGSNNDSSTPSSGAPLPSGPIFSLNIPTFVPTLSTTQILTAPVSQPTSVTVGGSTHTVTVISVGGNSVTVTIQSDPITVTLVQNVPQDLDTNGDKINDLKVSYLGLESGTPKLSFINLTDEGELKAPMTINAGAYETNSRLVTLSLNAQGASLMAISNGEAITESSYVPYTTTYKWTLSAGDGQKTVYVRFRTALGGEATYQDTITLAETSSIAVSCPLTPLQAYKSDASSAVYYITSDCTKRAFKHANSYFTYFASWASTNLTTQAKLDLVTNDTLGFMPLGPLYDPQYGALVKIVKDPKVYLLLGGNKHWITDANVFNALNYEWSWIEDVSELLLNKYTSAGEISDTSHHPNYTLIKYNGNAKVYRLEPNPQDASKQVKRWIVDSPTFESLNFRWDRIVTIPDSESYDNGADLKI